MGNLWQSTWTGALAGGVGGGAGAYLGNASWNVLGRGGAALGAGTLSGGVGAGLNGQHVGLGALTGAGLSYGSSVIQYAMTPAGYQAGRGISSDPSISDGDAVVFGPGKDGLSKAIAWVTQEDYSHAGQKVGGDLREAQKTGLTGGPLEQGTSLTRFDDRGYGVIGQGPNANIGFVEQPTGYNVCNANCATQVSVWADIQHANNPGVLYRINTGQGFYMQPYMHPWWLYINAEKEACMKVAVGLLLGLCNLSSAMYYLKHGPFAPKNVAAFDIDLGREYSFITNVDFQTHSGHTKGSDKVGPYTFTLISPSLKPRDDKENEVWKLILSRYHNKESSGELLFEWKFSEGETISQKCALGFNGHFGFGDGYGLCNLWLPTRSKREVTEVKVTVLEADSFLAENLKSPQIWIYRGGGK